ncbi:hypothetical protein SteCoe_9682 [Stentor coeruleus]|uniref:Protein kinase domain-containing protein n=1 Tax=Stentor coeruleus TaxID=5963 RepID=A0A1R2CHE3_9CILI|nr:hypothetical protein SteCoe_9682 [Stentor coeruleus]
MNSKKPYELVSIKGDFHIVYDMLSSYPYYSFKVGLILQTLRSKRRSSQNRNISNTFIENKDPLLYVQLLDSMLNTNLQSSDSLVIVKSLKNPEQSILLKDDLNQSSPDKQIKLFNISQHIDDLTKICFLEDNLTIKFNAFIQEILEDNSSFKSVKFTSKFNQDSFLVISFKDSDEEFQNERDGFFTYSHNSLMKFCGVLNKSRTLFFLYNPMTSLKKKVLLEECFIRKRLEISLEICLIFLYFHAKGQYLLATLGSFAISSCERIVLVRLRQKKSYQYTPPDFFLDTLSEKSDLYSLGMILYAVIFGQKPFNYMRNIISDEEYLQNIIFYKKRPEIPRNVPFMRDDEYIEVVPEVEGLLENLWETSPQDRISLLNVEEHLRMLVNKLPGNCR